MGEYAIRKSDNSDIKIGTCDNMYYLRMEDKDKVDYDGSWKNAFFRLPFSDEDDILPGGYLDYNRHVVLYNFECKECGDNPGTTQLKSNHGMLLNVPCHHGEKLPENTGDIKAFFNGKGPHYALYRIKIKDNKIIGLFGCMECGEKWTIPLEEIIDNVYDKELKARLQKYL